VTGVIRDAEFRPAWWLRGAHAQTLWSSLLRWSPRPVLRRERLELSDGDFLDLDWTPGDSGPIVILLHGLEGSSDSGYVRGLLAILGRYGWRGVVLHFRGCSGTPNRLARCYNAGHTEDIAHVVPLLRQREPHTSLAAVGFSLGGNVLLKWLGETGSDCLQAAVAVSTPMVLDAATRRMQQGFARLYQAHLLASLKKNYRRKFRHRHDGPVTLAELTRIRDFYAYDECITAPLHGYANADDYYRRASCRQYLRNICTPTLILHSLDDPLMSPEVVPSKNELADSVTLELSPYGGHVGFVSGDWPWRMDYWLDRRIPCFLTKYL